MLLKFEKMLTWPKKTARSATNIADLHQVCNECFMKSPVTGSLFKTSTDRLENANEEIKFASNFAMLYKPPAIRDCSAEKTILVGVDAIHPVTQLF